MVAQVDERFVICHCRDVSLELYMAELYRVLRSN